MAATTPPQIPGFTFVEPIGAGGFADVYVYQQHLPSRRVAVKVLKKGADSRALEMFYAEANVMAQLSSHPSIMPIFQADVADGHPYLVMEFCPGPHLARRLRAERIPVAEVLETAVKVASAVETAHRAGILHRDIKPHNILTNAYGSPLLTDFGIASSVGSDAYAGYAMSIPWSAPEVLSDQPSADVRSDVFSLAATAYSLLAGRSPFEVPGAANDHATLIHRIERQQPSRILRNDVPDSLSTALLRAMAKRPDDRPQSAMEFARTLQEIEIELHRTPTRLEVLDAGVDTSAPSLPANDDRTMIKPVSVIVPEQLAPPSSPPPSAPSSMTVQARRFAPAPPGAVDQGPALQVPAAAYARPAQPPPAGPPSAASRRESRSEDADRRVNPWVLLVVGLVVAAVVVFGAVSMLRGGEDPQREAGGFEQPPADAVGQAAPAPPVTATRIRQGWRFTWENPAPEPGDLFKVVRTIDGEDLPELRIAATSLDFRIRKGRQGCVSVTVIRKNITQRGEASEPLCKVGE